MLAHRFTLGIALTSALAAMIALGTAERVRAQEAKAAAEKADSEKDAGDKDAEETKDRFALPEGGVKELLAFIQETLKFRPTTREEYQEYRTKGLAAMKEAAEKIKKIATDEDKELPGYAEVDPLLLYFRVQEVRDMTPEERQQLLDDLKTYVADTPLPSQYGMGAVRSFPTTLEYGGDPQMAIVAYEELGGLLAKKTDPEIAKTGEKMEGAARRLDLVGKPLKVSGTEMDGTKFDWDKLRGKVVLVDFWATWCGPCRAELPNVKKNYELYHDKGFEVVGISLDRDRKALEEFLADEQNPWITLHDGDWSDNETANYYGVMGIPTVILVDKEGKVVSTRARGPELSKLLEELLGPPEEKTSEDDKESAAKTD